MATNPPAVQSPPIPTLAGFKAWVYAFMDVPTTALDSNSLWFNWAFDASMAIVNYQLKAAPGPTYMLAVYNLGGDNLVNWVVDDPGEVPADYWSKLRLAFGINSAFFPGWVTAASDEGTSSSSELLDFFKGMTLANLLNMKTPWGRQYLAYAQAVGTLWGIT